MPPDCALDPRVVTAIAVVVLLVIARATRRR